MKLLIVEDEFMLADVIKDRLEEDDFEVDLALDGEEGEFLALSGTYDLIIMDRMLPGIDGIDIVRHIREQEIVCPVLMLTARSQLFENIEGLNNGADDYMTKPFEMEELVARVNAMLRRNAGYGTSGLMFGDIVLHTKSGQLECQRTGKCVDVSAKELMLMEYLLMNRNQTVTKAQISERIWDLEEDVEYNNAEVYISFLRKKLKRIDANVVIRTMRGIGYCLEEGTL